jgi:hypothetical protein
MRYCCLQGSHTESAAHSIHRCIYLTRYRLSHNSGPRPSRQLNPRHTRECAAVSNLACNPNPLFLGAHTKTSSTAVYSHQVGLHQMQSVCQKPKDITSHYGSHYGTPYSNPAAAKTAETVPQTPRAHSNGNHPISTPGLFPNSSLRR